MASEVRGLGATPYDYDQVGSVPGAMGVYDYEVQVCTGVFKNRKEVFAK